MSDTRYIEFTFIYYREQLSTSVLIHHQVQGTSKYYEKKLPSFALSYYRKCSSLIIMMIIVIIYHAHTHLLINTTQRKCYNLYSSRNLKFVPYSSCGASLIHHGTLQYTSI